MGPRSCEGDETQNEKYSPELAPMTGGQNLNHDEDD